MWRMFQVEDVSIRDTSPNWHTLKLPLHQAVYRGNSIILAAKNASTCIYYEHVLKLIYKIDIINKSHFFQILKLSKI